MKRRAEESSSLFLSGGLSSSIATLRCGQSLPTNVFSHHRRGQFTFTRTRLFIVSHRVDPLNKIEQTGDDGDQYQNLPPYLPSHKLHDGMN